MELKVRVDGIPRIVCGVTENTTCQDIVIALAHAMGRTGTFTLIEKWQDNERPLNKAEFPVKVLQKWGEYANEVQLLLQLSDQTKKEFQKSKDQVKSKENFQHNFTPPLHKEGPVRRSLTFSGAHNVANPSVKRKNEQQKHSCKLQNISEKENIGDVSLTQSLPTYRFMNSSKQRVDRQPPLLFNPPPPAPHQASHHPYAQVRNISRNQNVSEPQIAQHHQPPSQPHIPQEETTHYANQQKPDYLNRPDNHTHQHAHHGDRNDISGKYKHFNGELEKTANQGPHQNKYSPVHTRTGSSPARNSPNKIASPVSPTDSRGQSPNLSLYNRNRQSAFSPVIPRQKSPNSPKTLVNGDLDFRVYSPEQESSDVVEYDLDSNFPDLYSGKKKDQVVEEYYMPGEKLASPIKEVCQDDSEFVKMQELVTRQQERIKHQESQLEVIDSEITTLEKKDIEQANELIQIADDKNKLEQKRKQFETELSKLESTKWVDLVQAERQAEAKIRSEILEFKSQTTKVGSELKNLQNKLNSLEKDIENEKNELKEEKEKQELEEKQLKEEVEKVKIKMKTLSDTGDGDKLLIVNIENELKELSEELDRKKDEVVQLEKKLKDANMREFKQVTPMGSDKGKPSDSGEVVLKVLEGRKSPNLGIGRKMIASPLSKILSVSKNPNGVWV
ncbi:RASSF7_8 [Mytilus coruscus]|uniref:RASSF7_8 n=1 Tax=Mytilus coruscus TaxID=42192 RepID=A0A6J8E875_MYTCO|nr:RASSF7_8 [Mytilus coruscus]